MLLLLAIVVVIVAILIWVYLTTPPKSWHQQFRRGERRL